MLTLSTQNDIYRPLKITHLLRQMYIYGMLYIHQFPDWTNFRFDYKKILNMLGMVRLEEGRLLGLSQILDDTQGNSILTADIQSNFAIDDFEISKNTLISLIENLPTADITQDKLIQYYKLISEKPKQNFRTNTGIVSRTISENKTFTFQGVAPERIPQEVGNFIKWARLSPNDEIIKTAIAHFWLITIRPFENANGRIARAITTAQFMQAESTKFPLYSINEQILLKREEYFEMLSKAQAGNGDLTEWLLWMMTTQLAAIRKRIAAFETSLQFQKLKIQGISKSLSERELQIIDAIITNKLKSSFSVKNVASVTGTSHDSALRDIQHLMAEHILTQNKKGGRSTSYSLAEFSTDTTP